MRFFQNMHHQSLERQRPKRLKLRREMLTRCMTQNRALGKLELVSGTRLGDLSHILYDKPSVQVSREGLTSTGSIRPDPKYDMLNEFQICCRVQILSL